MAEDMSGASPPSAGEQAPAAGDANKSRRRVRRRRKFRQQESREFPETAGDWIDQMTPENAAGNGAAAVAPGSPANEDQEKQVLEEAEAAEIVLRKVSETGKKLLVLDINGLLVDTYFAADDRPSRKHDAVVGRYYVYRRPHCEEFLKFCLENFAVAVWSSAKYYNVSNLVNYVFGDSKSQLVFSWNQKHCTNTGLSCLQKKNKPLFLKELSRVWASSKPEVPWERGDYGPWNTLLIDDSPHKVLRNPKHTAVLALTYSALDEMKDEFLPTLQTYLQQLLLCEDVQEFVGSNPIGQSLITESDPDWEYYLRVINESVEASEQVLDCYMNNNSNNNNRSFADLARKKKKKKSKKKAWVEQEMMNISEADEEEEDEEAEVDHHQAGNEEACERFHRFQRRCNEGDEHRKRGDYSGESNSNSSRSEFEIKRSYFTRSKKQEMRSRSRQWDSSGHHHNHHHQWERVETYHQQQELYNNEIYPELQLIHQPEVNHHHLHRQLLHTNNNNNNNNEFYPELQLQHQPEVNQHHQNLHEGFYPEQQQQVYEESDAGEGYKQQRVHYDYTYRGSDEYLNIHNQLSSRLRRS